MSLLSHALPRRYKRVSLRAFPLKTGRYIMGMGEIAEALTPFQTAKKAE